MSEKSQGAGRRGWRSVRAAELVSPLDGATRAHREAWRRPRRDTALLALLSLLAVAGCTAVSPEKVKSYESSGVTRRYDRPASDLYTASVAAIDGVRSSSTYWDRLAIVERDPAKGTVIAEQNLDSAVIPGLGTRDAIGIFVKDVPPDESDVTVVVMSSDQIPGSAGTSASSWPTASSAVFPAIDHALESVPATPRTATAVAPAAAPRAVTAPPPPPSIPAAPAAAPPPATAPSAIAPTAPVAAPAAATSRVATLDRVYDVLRANGTWRPLVRETRVDGTEEIRVGTWASLTDTGDGRVRLTVIGANAPAADAARLALELSQAGFAVTVDADATKHRAR
jgi:hypothetical protein